MNDEEMLRRLKAQYQKPVVRSRITHELHASAERLARIEDPTLVLAVDAKRTYRRVERERLKQQEAELECALGVAAECAKCSGVGQHVEYLGSRIEYTGAGVLRANSEIAAVECPQCNGTGYVRGGHA